MASDAVTVLVQGFWFHAGQPTRPIALVETTETRGVVFGEAPIESRHVHGRFEWLELENGCPKMILCFHRTNTNAVGIRPKALKQISQHLWLEEEHKEEMLYITHTDPFNFPLQHQKFDGINKDRTAEYIREHAGLDNLETVHSIGLCIHPGKDPVFAAMHKRSSGVQLQGVDKSWGVRNGTWAYSGAS